MADKEEIIEITINDRYCENYCKAFPLCCNPSCEHIDKPNVRYTRQEAIDIMAKAICWEREHYPFEELPQYAIDYYVKQAKAALNALLEGVE